MWTRPAILALLLATGPAQAQSAGDSATSLDLCFRSASLADEICTKLKDAPLQQLECWRKTQASQLACLEHVLADQTSKPSAGPTRGAAPLPSTEIVPETQPKQESADDSNGKDRQHAANQASDGGGEAEARSPADSDPHRSVANATTGVSPEHAKAPDPASAKSWWLVSETASPIDYSPIVDAEIRPIIRAQDGPDALAISCRARRIEVVIRRKQAWSGSPGRGLEVEYQIAGRPAVRETWILSADGKVAKKGSPAEFLQSTPDGATLKIAVGRRLDAQYTRFELVGLSAIRPSVEKACGEVLGKSRTSSGKP